MALTGALVEAATSYVVQKLGEFSVGRSKQFLEIAGDINFIKGEFSLMKAFLRVAERRMETNEAFDEWVEQIKNAAFLIEDFMDEYIHAEQALQAGGSSSSNKMASFRWQMVTRIEEIKNEVATISRRGQAYGLHLTQTWGLGRTQDEGESSSAVWHRPVHSLPFEEVDIVGFDEDVRKLKGWFLTEDEMPWSIMSVVGMGGSGKTTLAKRVYNLVQCHFDLHFWVRTSKYSPSQLDPFLKDIIIGLHNSDKGKARKLKRKYRQDNDSLLHRSSIPLRDLLRGKRYALFLDDINDIRFWRTLEDELPTNGRGKIIFTSREKIACSPVRGNQSVHVLDPLPFELAWELFCKKAFRNHTSPGICPNYLKGLGEAIVRSCGGLPLAVVLMGCLMSNKDNSPKTWKDVADHFGLEVLHNPSLQSLNRILQLSYQHLPSHLKYCFLNCCLFPKNYKIKRKKITRLWVAQGLVEKQEGKSLEDVANEYFVQLTEKSFLQPIISEFTGELKECTVHEIMHNFALSKFPEEFGILIEKPCNDCEQKRLLALHNNHIPCKKPHSKARTFLSCKSFSDHQMNELLSLKFLMVLCLDGTAIKELPHKLGDLVHLRYLGLKGTQIEVFPDSIGKLYNLETLDVRDTRIQSIPANLGGLKKLRHLLLKRMKVYGCSELVKMPTSIGNLEQLQTLSGVEADQNFIREVRHLVHLRKLYIRLTGPKHSSQEFASTIDIQNSLEHPHEQLLASIKEIENLCSLKVESLDKNGMFTELRLQTSFPPAVYLEKLTLGGVVAELPLWFGHLNSLRVLVLINSMLIADPLSELAMLPNLVSLKLIHAYTGEQMGCGPEGFPKLQYLHIASLVAFKEWTTIAEGAMPHIQFLSIFDCNKLKRLPKGFERLKTLQSLEAIGMCKAFIERLMGKDNFKIQDIPKIYLSDSANIEELERKAEELKRKELE